MSETQNTAPTPTAPEQPITPEQKAGAIRDYLKSQLEKKYNELSNLVREMNLPTHIAHSLFWDLDKWYGMAQQMVVLVNFAPAPQPAPPAPLALVPEPAEKQKRKYRKRKNAKRKPA